MSRRLRSFVDDVECPGEAAQDVSRSRQNGGGQGREPNVEDRSSEDGVQQEYHKGGYEQFSGKGVNGK